MGYQLRRIPGTCCPDPECDRVREPEECPECGAKCSECKRGIPREDW